MAVSAAAGEGGGGGGEIGRILQHTFQAHIYQSSDAVFAKQRDKLLQWASGVAHRVDARSSRICHQVWAPKKTKSSLEGLQTASLSQELQLTMLLQCTVSDFITLKTLAQR